MARMLNTNDAAIRCINTIRRHQRLCKQVVNDEELILQIQTTADVLISKDQVLQVKQVERENAYDDVILYDRYLDDTVRSVFEDCKQFDRKNRSETVLSKIFPDEKFGEIVRLPFAKEISDVQQISVRLKSLGEDHELFALAEQLDTSIANSKSALKTVDESITSIKMAEAEVEIAKEALIRRYEINYLEARKKYGRNTAEKLFPKIYSRKTITEIENEAVEAA